MATIVNHNRPFVTCQHCERGIHENLLFCPHCGYPQVWSADAVKAPQSLIRLAMDWHEGQASGLYSVLSTGKIFKSKAIDVECELRKAMLDSRRLKEGHDCDDVARHLRAIEHLTAQLPDEE